MISKNILVVSGILIVTLFISTFMPWFSYVSNGALSTASGWTGSVSLFQIRIQNWLVSLLAIIFCVLLILKNLYIWDSKLRWFIPILGVVGYHLTGFSHVLFTMESRYQVTLAPGYFLLILATVISAILFSKLENAPINTLKEMNA